MGEAYQYSTLQSDNLIRLTTLEPGDFDDDLVVQIISAPFDEATRLGYTALSYVWGDESDPARVYVRDGGDETNLCFCQVTRNLEMVLRYLRERQSPLQLWIDAICINQADNKEKSTQVRRMGDVYRLASRVLAWLGPPSADSKRGLEWLGLFGADIKYDCNTAQLTPAENATDPHLGDPHALLRLDLDLTEGIIDIMERQWFKRLWIRQEIMLADASQAVIQCGNTRVPWRDLQNALYGFGVKRIAIGQSGLRSRQMLQEMDFWNNSVKQEEVLRELVIHKRLVDAFSQCLDVARQRVPIELSELRRGLQRAECKDDRDRVFAALDMLNPAGKELGIVPDYTMTAAQVYHDLAIRNLRRWAHPTFLGSCYLKDECDSDSDYVSKLPSWAPNFAEPLPVYAEPFGYASSDLIAPHAIANCPKRGDNMILRIWGVPGATIQELASPYSLPTFLGPSSEVRHLLSALLPASSFACGLDDPHPNGDGTVLEHYAAVLLGYIFLKENVSIDTDRLPSLKNSAELLRALLAYRASQDGDSQDDDSQWEVFLKEVAPLPDFAHFTRWAARRLTGCRVALSTDQHVLLVPDSARIGDQACTLLGCTYTMLLRPALTVQDESDKYRVVGPCYIRNMTFGDALLGPLPPSVRVAQSVDVLGWVWLNKENEIVSRYDPRMDALLAKLQGDEINSYRKLREQDPRPAAYLNVDMNQLQEHRRSVNAPGGDLRYFELI